MTSKNVQDIFENLVHLHTETHRKLADKKLDDRHIGKHLQPNGARPRITTLPSLSLGLQKGLQDLARLYWDSR